MEKEEEKKTSNSIFEILDFLRNKLERILTGADGDILDDFYFCCYYYKEPKHLRELSNEENAELFRKNLIMFSRVAGIEIDEQTSLPEVIRKLKEMMILEKI